MPVRRRAADDGEDHAEPGAGNAEAHGDLQQLVLDRSCGESRGHEATRIHQGAENDGTAVAELFGDRAEDWLADAPGEILDCDREGEFGAQPAELLGDRDLEYPEARPNGKAEHENCGPGDQHWGNQSRTGHPVLRSATVWHGGRSVNRFPSQRPIGIAES